MIARSVASHSIAASASTSALAMAGRRSLATTAPRLHRTLVVPPSPSPSPSSQLLPSRRPFSSSAASTQQEQQSSQAAPEPTSGESEIISLLTKRFQPSHLQVQDVSGGCGSFYAIVVAAKDFQGLNTVKQHRLVNECLKDIIGGIHGLQLKTIPAE